MAKVELTCKRGIPDQYYVHFSEAYLALKLSLKGINDERFVTPGVFSKNINAMRVGITKQFYFTRY